MQIGRKVKYFKVIISFPGRLEEVFRFESTSREDADQVALAKAIERYESHGFTPEVYRKELGTDIQYCYEFSQVPRKLYNLMDCEEIQPKPL